MLRAFFAFNPIARTDIYAKKRNKKTLGKREKNVSFVTSNYLKVVVATFLLVYF